MASAPHIPEKEALALLRGALSGNARAERDLVRHVLIPVVDAAVCQEMLRARRVHADREEAVQDVLTHLYEDGWARLRRFDPDHGSLRAWVSTIAHHRAIDIVRRPCLPAGGEEELEDRAVEGSGPESNVRLAEHLDRLIAALRPDDLELLRWRWFEGLECAEIARRLGISIDAVYRRLERLEARVRAIFGSEEKIAS